MAEGKSFFNFIKDFFKKREFFKREDKKEKSEKLPEKDIKDSDTKQSGERSDLPSKDEETIQENIRKARRKGMGEALEESKPGSKKKKSTKKTDDKNVESIEPVIEKETKSKTKDKKIKVKKKRIRRVFYRAAIFIFLLFHVIIGAMTIVLSPSFVEKQIIENFNKLSYGTLSLKVKKISLLTGFQMDNIVIHNGPEFDKSVFFKLKRLKISYSLPAFLFLNINIPEIGIYSPHVWLKQKNGVWNAARLMKPSPPAKKEEKKIKKEEKKEEKKEPGKPLDKIELPIALRFLFNFILDDVRAYVDSEGSKPHYKDKFNAGLEGFGVKVGIHIPPVKTIPLIPPTDIISIFQKIHIQVNKNRPMNVWYKAREVASKPPLYLNFLVYLDKKKNAFRSKMKVGVVRAPVRIKRMILTPLNFIIAHDLQFYPKKDLLKLNYFKVTFKRNDWLNLKGTIKNVQTKPELNIRMARSVIVLDHLYPYFLKFTGNRKIHFGGKISLKPLAIVGKQDDLKVDGALNLYRIKAKVPGLKRIRISRFHLDYHTRLKGNPPEPKYFRIDNWYAYLNGARIKGKVNVKLKKNMPAGPMKVAFSLTNLRPERFVNAGAVGPVNLYLNVNSKNGLRDITTKVKVNLRDFIYTLNDSRSRPLNLDVGVNVFTALTNKMKNIDVDLKKISLLVRNRKKNDAVRLGISGKIALRQKRRGPKIDGKIRLDEIFLHQKNLFDTFPDALRAGATREEQPLKHPVNIAGLIQFALNGPLINSNGSFGIKAPTFDVNDLKIGYKVKLNTKKSITEIVYATVGSEAKHLLVSVKGKLAPKKVFDKKKRKYVNKVIPNIYAKVAIQSPVDSTGKKQLFTVYKTPDGGVINIGGDIIINTHIEDQDLDGNIQIKQFRFNDGKMTSVENLNMFFPFELKLDYQRKVSKLAITQADVLRNFNFSEKPNFTIEAIKAKHPSRNKPYAYLKNFQALMFVRDNTFELKKMRAVVLDGQLIGKDTLFYLGNLKPEQMAYRVKINVINIDMAALDQSVVKKQEEGGLLSAYINLAGVNPAAADPKGYIVVNKIGADIADQLMRALNEKEGESKLGIAQPVQGLATQPESFEFRLGDGNIYTRVKLYRRGVSLLADLHPEELKYDRIPIQEFISGLK